MKKSLACLLATSLFAFAAGAHAGDRQLKSVGVTVGDLANPYFVAVGQSVTREAHKINPNAQVTVVSAKYDLNTQVGQIDNFIANKVDLIILGAADSKGIGPEVKKAQKAGIVVVAVDVSAEGADATVMSDNTMAGGESCKYIAQQMNGKGSIVIVNGPPVSSIIDRVTGCKTELKKFPAIKILSDNQNAGGSRDGGLTSMSNLLAAYPKIDAVFGVNDPTAIGAELAIKQAKRSDIKLIGGVDGGPDGIQALKTPQSLFVVSPAQDPNGMAAQAVDVGYALMNGHPPKDKVKLLPTPPITRANVATYQGWIRD
ncbi:ABC transporter substrate-binding protein [Paraburkholderia rhizosphaerae]|uniref:Monosaccharide ABC transporter substrate-binding protein (CUT2 family) n=1 Tax=Paraburkholderia rhizosphaerae TaxID=480658 RepID=A0A4R8LVG7_9BURK|nr:ABC transporter substrate-binding protein [Paraburkholderia rhizosphaerae]TDY51809.1 monosaccharide ABC transporter substrate-binding protein (CUT2 family) [Paraburkholderia rhizosphaerae]